MFEYLSKLFMFTFDSDSHKSVNVIFFRSFASLHQPRCVQSAAAAAAAPRAKLRRRRRARARLNKLETNKKKKTIIKKEFMRMSGSIFCCVLL